MIVMFLFYSDEHAIAELSIEGRNALVERHVHYNNEVLDKRAKVLAARGLEPSDAAVTVRPIDGRLTVREGPFADTAEALAGFYLVEVAGMDEAIELARAYPMPEGLGCIELRPVMRTWDYAPSYDSPAKPSTIWNLYADVDSWPDWKVGIKEVKLDGPFETGTSGWLTPTDQPAMPFHIVEAKENESYVSETEIARKVQLRLEHYLTPLPHGGTRVTHRATIPRAALNTFGLNFSPEFNAGIRRTLRQLSAVAVKIEAARS
jgi:hypothetical protein